MLAIISNLRKGKPQNTTADSETGWLKTRRETLCDRFFQQLNSTVRCDFVLLLWGMIKDERPELLLWHARENRPLSIYTKIQIDSQA